jgi:hypothetical protein
MMVRIPRRTLMTAVGWVVGWCATGWAQPGTDAVPPAPAATVTANLLADRPIGQLRASIASPAMRRPPNVAATALRQAPLPASVLSGARGWCLTAVDWDAAATRSLPLYFEEPNLERGGYYYGKPYNPHYVQTVLWPVTTIMESEADEFWLKQRYFDWYAYHDQWQPTQQIIQPVVSAGAFFGRIAILPYQWGIDPPREPVYDLGADRPGSPVPYQKDYLPLSLRGGLYQGAAVTGLGFVIP